MLKTQSIELYLNELASAAPTPGGGAAAAVTSAQGVALLEMVCNLTLGKKKFSSVEAEILKTREQLEKQRSIILEFGQRDINVFQAVLTAYQLPKDTNVELGSRKEAIQIALKAACEVPFGLFKLCSEILPSAGLLKKIGNPSVLSDVIVGEHLLVAGLLGAEANIYANLVHIDDVNFCKEKREYINLTKANSPQPTYPDRTSPDNGALIIGHLL